MDNLKNIPKHWQIKKLGEVADYLNGRAFKPSEWEPNGKPIIRIQNLNKPQAEYNYSTKEYEERYKVQKNDLLYAWSASLGVFIWKGKDAWLNQHIFKVVPHANCDKKFLFYTLEKITAELYSKAHDSGMVHVTKGKFENTEIPFPSLPEQQAIVAKIEQLFSELDKGKQQLLTTQQQLKTYRQSLLKWAFEGKLTNKNLKEGELPKGWIFEELKNVCVIKRGKSKHRPRNEPTLFGGKYPFIQTGDIREANGGYIKKYSQTYSEIGLQQSKLWPKGTLCITIAANIGETAILNFDACFPDSVVGLISNEKMLLNKYTNYFFISHKSKLEELAPATAQKNINVDILEKVKIPLPSVQEQQLIVSELESKLTVCDKIEETISQALQQAETLRQSILKKAFEGKLVAAIDEIQEAKVIPLVAADFPKKVEGISTTDLHAGIISMVIDIHQNSPRYSDKLNHVKCEKISDLVERKLGISLGRVAMKDAAGPDDFNHLKKVEHRASMAGFFKPVALEPIGHTYKPMRNMQKAIEKTKAALSAHELKQVNDLLNVFLPFELEHAELVATLFAGWNNLLLSGKIPTDEEIVFESRENWSKRKLTIDRSKFFKTLKWMKEHNYIPEGKGQLVLKKEEVKKVNPKKKKLTEAK